MSPEQIRDQDVFPKGFYPLPHPKHQEGGFVFPRFLIDEIKRQEERDLTRFDVEYDIPDHFLPEFPPALYLNQRTDLGDVSQGKLITINNYFELFNGIIPPKQIEGLRLLVTPFPQQQYNETEDRRSEKPSRGATCFDCHSNGHTNKATHLAPDARPQETRHRIVTPPLRGVQIQRLFVSQRDLKTERLFKPVTINNMYATSDGAIKTFTLRGVKNQPPYMHDGRLLTLDDTVEFFNLILGTKLTGSEKQDLVAFLRAL